MEFTRKFQWMNILIAVSCSVFLFVVTPVWAGTTSVDETLTITTVNPTNYLYVEPDSTDVYIQYDYDQPVTYQDSPASVTTFNEDYRSPAPDKSPDQFSQFSSGTTFVNYYLAPLGPTFKFLDRDRRHAWQRTTLKYTFIDLDSSLSYKSTMMGWDFKAMAEGEVMDESSLSLNWSRHF